MRVRIRRCSFCRRFVTELYVELPSSVTPSSRSIGVSTFCRNPSIAEHLLRPHIDAVAWQNLVVRLRDPVLRHADVVDRQDLIRLMSRAASGGRPKRAAWIRPPAAR